MEAVHLFDLATRHAEWASVRQAVITGNIANANTPGFKARDIEPFRDVLEQTRLVMAKTAPGHLDIEGAELGAARSAEEESWGVSHSGNSVSIDQELIKAGEVNRAFALNASITRAFHRMVLAAVRTP